MAVVSTDQNLTSVSYTAGETITIQNNATLTIDSTPATRPGTIRCLTKGKLLVTNASTTVPIKLSLYGQNYDYIFQGQGIMEVSGAMMELGTGTGSSQTFDFTTLYSGLFTDITYVEVEESVGSGTYHPWHIAEINSTYYHVARYYRRGSIKTEWDGNQKVFFWDSITRQLTTGDNTNGMSVPSGCKIRIPNILITQRFPYIDQTLIHQIIGTIASGAGDAVPSGGTFTITIINRETGSTLGTTAAIAYNASAATVDSAIEAITGAGTVTSGGGPLPATVSITWAGAYASTPLALVINAGSITPANATILSLENSAASMTLITLNPGGVINASCCMFSRKIRWSISNSGSVTLSQVGVGGDGLALTNSTEDFILDSVSIVTSPYIPPTTVLSMTLITGNVSYNKLTITSSASSTSQIFIGTMPLLSRFDYVWNATYTYKISTSVYTLTATVLPENLIINRYVGGAVLFTSCKGVKLISPRLMDHTGPAQLTTIAGTGVTISTDCQDVVVYDLQPYGTARFRGVIYSINGSTKRTKIINTVYDGLSNTIGLSVGAGDNVELINNTITNMRTASVNIDSPVGYYSVNLMLKKLFATMSGTNTTQSWSGGQYDLVASSMVDIDEVMGGGVDFVGGNFMDYGTTPTTGHVTFFGFFTGTSLQLTGQAYNLQTGAIAMPDGDTLTAEIPFAMHGITAFQNVSPLFILQGAGAFGNQHTIINEGGCTGGTFTVSVYNSSDVLLGTTAAQAYNVSTTNLDTAIEGIAGVGTGVTVTGSLTAGYLITMPTGNFRITVDGVLLTGGTEPGVAYAFCRMNSPTRTYESNAGSAFTFEYQVKLGDSLSWPVLWTSLTGANLFSAIAAFDTGEYDEGGNGLRMRIRVTTTGTDKYRTISQVSLPTNIDPSLWTTYDSTITFRGPAETDYIKIRRASDDVELYSFIGSGTHSLNVGDNFNTQVYFERSPSGTGCTDVYMRTLPVTQALVYGDNGTIDLFYGAEVQLAQSSNVDLIKATVDAYLDATISSRCTQTTGDQIKANTNLIPATL